MNDSKIFSHVDHTLLTATATEGELSKLCEEAVLYKTASVCIPPYYVKLARELYPKLNIGTVIGFPLGYATTSTKVYETETALENTADEFDMVINLTDVKNAKFNKVGDEIALLKNIVKKKILKVIIETCYLNEDEKITLCKVVTDSGADYIKTSTGFGTAGATIADVNLFKANIGAGVKIKAAGGIRTREDMVEYLNLSVDRLGTSSAVKILKGEAAGAY